MKEQFNNSKASADNINQKLDLSKQLLRNTDKSIPEIAIECGFDDIDSFIKLFNDYEKVTPNQFKSMLFSTEMSEIDLELYSELDHIKFLENIDAGKLEHNNKFKTYWVSKASEEFTFLHEAAIIKFKNILFSAWYNNSEKELQGVTPIRFSRSFDDGKTWDTPKIVANDEKGEIIYCPPVFGILNNKLYMFLNEMVSADHMHALDLYVYNEAEEIFECVWSKPIPFKLNTNIYKLSDNKLILPGRVAELDGFPVTPAVLISESNDIDEGWNVFKIQNDGSLPCGVEFIHPETSLIFNNDKLYAFVRNCIRKVPLVYISDDLGKTWSKPYAHDIPFSNSKIYSGMLQDGRNYVIGNLAPGRSKLAIFFSKPNTMEFDKGYLFQDDYSIDLNVSGKWHYPSAYEGDGKLYVIYTYNDTLNHRSAVITVIDLKDI